MAVFPSDAWLQLFKEEVNRSEAYRNAARRWEGSFLFVVEADGAFPETVTMFVDLWHGECRGARVLKPGEDSGADYTWSGKYSDWTALLSGEMPPSRMVVSGRFKIKGNTNRLLSGMSPVAADALADAAKRVPTELR